MIFSELKKKTELKNSVLTIAQKQQIKGGNDNGANNNPVDPTLGIGIIDTDII